MRSLTPLFLFALLTIPVFAADRDLTISAPSQAQPGASVEVVITVKTTDIADEGVKFLQAEFSVDGGETWAAICYDSDLGSAATRSVTIEVGPAATQTIIRARSAFRGGADGDVDFAGKPIAWEKSWSQWKSPPARIATIDVK